VDIVHKIQADYKDKARFVTIYIMEAHARDQWPLGRHVQVYQHKCLEDRIEIATQFVKKLDYQIPMYVDGIDNQFMKTWWCHPERYFIFHNRKVMMKAQPTDEGWYPFEPISDMLDQLSLAASKQ